MNKKTIEIKERNLALEAVRVTEAADYQQVAG